MAIFNLVATPRNLSTAIMYSFAQRSDMAVVDEPFYGFYLQDAGLDHPGREETLAAMESDPVKVLAQLSTALGGSRKEHLFIKNMAHHMEGLPAAYWKGMHHIFLVRDPRKLITSYARVIEHPTMANIGLDTQVKLMDAFRKQGFPVSVLDSDDLLSDPAAELRALCRNLHIPFEDSMLEWKAGPRPEDGVWAKYWYANVHRSTGFARQATSSEPLPGRCLPLYRECLPHYNYLLSIKNAQ